MEVEFSSSHSPQEIMKRAWLRQLKGSLSPFTFKMFCLGTFTSSGMIMTVVDAIN